MMITTKRLILTSLTEDYIIDINKYFTIDVTKYMYPTIAKDIYETTNIVKSMISNIEKKTDLIYVIIKKENSEFIGLAGLHNLKSDKPEIGIWTKINSHGNGYGREAIGGLIKYAKELEYKSLIYPVDKNNIASKKIPLAYNGYLVDIEKEKKTKDGRILNIETYEIKL